VEQLVEAKLATQISDLYQLDASKLGGLERMGSKSIENLLVGIEASKKQPAWRMLFGLGVLHVGSTSSQSLLDHFGSMDAIMKASLEELEAVNDVGTVVAKSLQDYFQAPDGSEELERLRAAGLPFAPNATAAQADAGPTSDVLAETTWVITGTLSQPRDHFAQLIKQHGGKVTGSVSAKTSFLLAGEKAGSKMAKAEKLGVSVLNEEDFLAKLAE
jgi:DNA ligase (NAD+)